MQLLTATALKWTPFFNACRFHPKSKLSENATQSDDSDNREDVIKMLRKFISLESRKSHKLKGALENMLEAEEANRKVAGNMS